MGGPAAPSATRPGTLPLVRVRKRTLVSKFFNDRGTHLAAMVAYFALLSFVPLVFLALSLLGFAHRADASDFLVKELSRAFPGSSVESILSLVHRVQDNAPRSASSAACFCSGRRCRSSVRSSRP